MKVGVQIEFLVTPQLSDPAAPRYGEWPPAPDRVFQALVATAAETGQDMEVIKHLESAPAVKASRALKPQSPIHYVPANYRNSKTFHPNAERRLPVVIPEDSVVTYIWDDIPESALPALGRIVEQITHIGRTSSMVRACLADGYSTAPNWIPDPNGPMRMRTPYPGRLGDLQDSFNAGLRSDPAPSLAYNSVEEQRPSTPWRQLMVLRPERQLALNSAAKWAESLRRAVMSVAEDQIPPLIHGHDNHRHVAWAAIPDVGHRYASGNILGLGCWLPADANLAEQGLVGSLLMKVSDLNGVKLNIDSVGLKGLQTSTWSCSARCWATVTPIALDRWPKRNKSPEQIVSDSLIALGLPEPANINCSNYSPVTGAANPRKYSTRHGNRFITHAVMEWEEPVTGPLLIGADRYFAGGLCLATKRRN